MSVPIYRKYAAVALGVSVAQLTRLVELGCPVELTERGTKRYDVDAVAAWVRGESIDLADIPKRRRIGPSLPRVRSLQRTQTYECHNCGVVFRPKMHDRTEYCSRECYYEQRKRISDEKMALRRIGLWWRHKTRPEVACVECGEMFQPANGESRCSKKCMNVNANRKSREYSVKAHGVRKVECRNCGEVFVSVYGSKRRVFCSDECMKRFGWEQNKIKRRTRGEPRNWHGSKGRLYVLKRDGYKCQLCGKKTRKELDVNHDLYPHADHVVPLSKGGHHVPENLQCLCRACNMAKGDGPCGSQLLLIG